MIMTIILFWYNNSNFSDVAIIFFNVLRIWKRRVFKKTPNKTEQRNKGKNQQSKARYLLNTILKFGSIIKKLQKRCLLHSYLQWTIVIILLTDLFHSWTWLINPAIPTALSGKEPSGEFVYWNCLMSRNVLS